MLETASPPNWKSGGFPHATYPSYNAHDTWACEQRRLRFRRGDNFTMVTWTSQPGGRGVRQHLVWIPWLGFLPAGGADNRSAPLLVSRRQPSDAETMTASAAAVATALLALVPFTSAQGACFLLGVMTTALALSRRSRRLAAQRVPDYSKVAAPS